MPDVDLAALAADRRAEIARRIGVIEDYLALPLPSASDDDEHAARIGVRSSQFLRLVRVWREHRRPELLGGALRRSKSREDRADRWRTSPTSDFGGITLDMTAAATHEVDLEGVHPHRRAEIRRRIDVVRRFLATPDRTPDDEKRFASELDLSVAAFRLLIAAWQARHRAADLPTARLPIARPRRLKSQTAAAAETIITSTIDDLGTNARDVDVFREVVARCGSAGHAPPSEHIVTNRLNRARANAIAASQAPEELVLDHCALRLAVCRGDARQVPVLTLAFVVPSTFIVAHELSLLPPGPQVTARVLAVVAARGKAETRLPLALSADFTSGWSDLLSALANAGVNRCGRTASPPPSSRLIRKFFGSDVGGIRLAPLFTHRPQASKGPIMGRRSHPLGWADAQAAVAAAVDGHNARVTQVDTPAIVAANNGLRLLDQLREIGFRPAEAPRRRRR